MVDAQMWLSSLNTWDTVIKNGFCAVWSPFGARLHLKRVNLSESQMELREVSLIRVAALIEARTLLSTLLPFSLPSHYFKMKKLCIVPPVVLPEVFCASFKKKLPLHSLASCRWCKEETKHSEGKSSLRLRGSKSVTYCLRAMRLSQELNVVLQ